MHSGFLLYGKPAFQKLRRGGCVHLHNKYANSGWLITLRILHPLQLLSFTLWSISQQHREEPQGSKKNASSRGSERRGGCHVVIISGGVYCPLKTLIDITALEGGYAICSDVICMRLAIHFQILWSLVQQAGLKLNDRGSTLGRGKLVNACRPGINQLSNRWTRRDLLQGFIPIVQSTRCTCYLKLFILVKRSTCFGRSFHPWSGS